MELVQVEVTDRIVYQNVKDWVIYVCSRDESVTTCLEEETNPELEALRKEFAIIFEEIKRLPPSKGT